jgi:hypothetical protein
VSDLKLSGTLHVLKLLALPLTFARSSKVEGPEISRQDQYQCLASKLGSFAGVEAFASKCEKGFSRLDVTNMNASMGLSAYEHLQCADSRPGHIEVG